MDLKDTGRRGSVRVKARLKVRFKDMDSFINEYTHNISKGGLFIRTNKPCNLRDRVEVMLILPETGEEVSAVGEVIHIITPEQASEQTPAGMGIQILEWASGAQDKIEKFIAEKLKTGNDIHGRRKHQRVEVKLRVKFESKEALVEEYIHNLSHGGIFIQTSKPRDVGEKFSIILVHPETNQELLLHGEVVRVVTVDEAEKHGLKPGMGIKFLEIDAYTQSEIEKFIKAETIKNAGRNLIVEET